MSILSIVVDVNIPPERLKAAMENARRVAKLYHFEIELRVFQHRHLRAEITVDENTTTKSKEYRRAVYQYGLGGPEGYSNAVKECKHQIIECGHGKRVIIKDTMEGFEIRAFDQRNRLQNAESNVQSLNKNSGYGSPSVTFWNDDKGIIHRKHEAGSPWETALKELCQEQFKATGKQENIKR